MAFNAQKAKEQNDKINALLVQQPEFEQIRLIYKDIEDCNSAIKHSKEQIDRERGEIEACESLIAGYKNDIKCLLEKLEVNTGFSKAPNLAHLMTVAESYQVKDVNAVPQEYIITEITSKLDKKKLNAAIKVGVVDVNSNWLEVTPSYKTVVIEK